MTPTAELSVTTLKGVGPSLSTTLQKLGIFRLIDLLLHLPIRYQDRTHLVPLRQLQAGQECLVQGQVVDSQVAYGRRRSWVVTLEDGTGYLSLRFFHFSKSQQASLKTGHYVRCFGEVRFGPKGLEMAHPEYRAFAVLPEEPEGRLTPVYPTTKGLGQGRLRNLTRQLADLSWSEDQSTPFQTLLYLHRPPADASRADIEQAQERVARDELTAYYLIMRHRQSQRAHQRALALPRSQQLGRELLKNLGFELTGAQRRVATEVLLDLEQAMPMLRLLQGDVGSGKTVIAAFAAIRAAEHGAQTALMAPTEILAEQHYFNFSTWLAPLGISVVLLTGAQTLKQRRPKLAALADGEALVAVGRIFLYLGVRCLSLRPTPRNRLEAK